VFEATRGVTKRVQLPTGHAAKGRWESRSMQATPSHDHPT